MHCVLNSSYSLIEILSKLHRCFGHGLKICMWFGYNPKIIVYYIIFNLTFITFPAFSPSVLSISYQCLHMYICSTLSANATTVLHNS